MDADNTAPDCSDRSPVLRRAAKLGLCSEDGAMIRDELIQMLVVVLPGMKIGPKELYVGPHEAPAVTRAD